MGWSLQKYGLVETNNICQWITCWILILHMILFTREEDRRQNKQNYRTCVSQNRKYKKIFTLQVLICIECKTKPHLFLLLKTSTISNLKLHHSLFSIYICVRSVALWQHLSNDSGTLNPGQIVLHQAKRFGRHIAAHWMLHSLQCCTFNIYKAAVWVSVWNVPCDSSSRNSWAMQWGTGLVWRHALFYFFMW